jgi:glycosyltransferase involved in cell wall biosynthesis
MRLAYLVNQYPKVSHTFIRREILALERRGIMVSRIALRGWDLPLASVEDHRERERTRFVLKEGVVRLLLCFMSVLVQHPLRMMRAFGLTWKMSRRSERPLPVHIAYLVEASCILRWLRHEKIEHVHAHFGTNSAEVAMLVHALGGPQWSMTVHGPDEFEKKHLIGLAEKVAHCAFVVAISSFGRGQIFKLSRLKDWPKVHVVHCGLDDVGIEREEGPPPSAPRLVCVGRLSEAKGHLLLLEAAHRLSVQGVNLELVFAGDGELRPKIEQLIVQYDLQKVVRITGWISGEQVRKEILAARALVLPSFAEGLPVAIMEAMALGRPVISTYIAGIPELVQSGDLGWLIPSGDVDALVDVIGLCLKAPPELLCRMGRAGRARVMERHNVDTEARKLESLFRMAIGSGR